MDTRLSLFCQKVIEAGWLAAAIAVPLFFNIYSGSIFEPDKIALLRSLALVMSAAWVVKAIERWRREDQAGLTKGQASLLELPLVIPTLALVGVYLLTTLTSLVPRVSLWGSYQRLQGTYTTLSYIVIFFLTLEGLRSRRQLERLITVMLVASFPVALYGLVQHFGLDPLPWGEDVTERVASNMGNSIFVAAYLIMVFPLALGRFLERLRPFWEEARPVKGKASALHILLLLFLALSLPYLLAYQLFFLSDVNYVAGSKGLAFLLGLVLLFIISTLLLFSLARRQGMPRERWIASQLLLFAAQGLALTYTLLLIFKMNYLVAKGGMGGELLAFLGVMALFVAAFWFTFREESLSSYLLGVLYALLLATQLICIVFTQSRGPLLGLLAGLFVFVLVTAIRRRLTWLWASALTLALAGALFLGLFNLPSGPLSGLKELPYFGRLGRVLEMESGTGKVRLLIWEGALKLISPHEPIGLPPDHLDRLNLIRPLVGYGPESMYVAYFQVYPPELGHYEAPNRSPDRSHNETFDALVTTGFLGLLAYLCLFGSLFYYALKWLGFIDDGAQRHLYVTLLVLGGLLGAIGPRLLEGTWRLSGVGLAAGMVVGLLAYLVSRGFSPRPDKEPPLPQEWLLVALLSALVAHFVEIHFGIAIAVTRTYFWLYAALLALVGLQRWGEEEALPNPIATSDREGKRRGRKKAAPPSVSLARWWEKVQPTLPYSLLLTLLLVTLAFDFINPGFDPAARGFSIPWLLFLAWLVGTGVIFAERGEASPSSLLLHLALSGGLLLIFAVIQWRLASYRPTITTIEQVVSLAQNATQIIFIYYLALFGLLFLSAWALLGGEGRAFAPALWPRRVAYLVVAPLAAFAIIATNLNLVRADIFYKQGLEWESRQQWEASMALYEEAIKLAPQQDWYYLFLGRAIVETAKGNPEGQATLQPQTAEDFLRLSPEEVAALDRDSLMRSGVVVLERARAISPYNPDHAANLGRLHTVWGQMTQDLEGRRERLEKALDYYEKATTLSSHNVRLFNEWGRVYLLLEDYQGALTTLQRSLALDPAQDEGYLLLLDLYAARAHQISMATASEEVREHLGAGYAHIGEEKIEEALQEFLAAERLDPTNLGTHIRLASLFYQTGRLEEALDQARLAREMAPLDQRPFWDSLMARWEGK